MERKFVSQNVLLGLFLLFYSLFFFQKIDLTHADLGQHLKSGEIFWKQGFPVSTNYYSYTAPDYPAVNHRWAAGAIYHAIWRISGFEGLSIFQSLLNVSVLFFFLLAARNKSDPLSAFFFAMLAVPLITLRTEIRPEFFSYFFLSVYFFLLSRLRPHEHTRILWVLPLMQVLWVNLHFFFFLGPFLILLFWLENRSKFLLKIFLTNAAACLINPFHIHGALSFVSILAGQRLGILAENQSTLKSGGPCDWYFQWMLATESILILAALLKKKTKRHMPSILMTLCMGAVAWKYVRNYPLFGLFFIPVSAGIASDLIHELPGNTKERARKTMLATLSMVVAASLLIPGHLFSPWKGSLGIGLLPENERAAILFKKFRLEGPIYNNYDIGGYLIFELFPKERVFTDNRPEAYPPSFFPEIYTPISAGEGGWKAMDKKYGFNVIFSRYDSTEAPKNLFLARRLKDPEWALFYVDDRILILLKRSAKNAELIRKMNL